MHGSKVLWIAILATTGCVQLEGIQELPNDGVPAISGTYVVGIDFRQNAAIGSVVLMASKVSYDRDARVATFQWQPYTTATGVLVGDLSSTSVSVASGSPPTYTGTGVSIAVAAEANTAGFSFLFAGSVTGVFHDENQFCGIVSGTYTRDATEAPLPSVTLGGLKDGLPTGAVPVDCAGDQFTR